jgi:hypothetical protein
VRVFGIAKIILEKGNLIMDLSKILKKLILLILLFVLLATVVGCSSGFKTIVPMPPEKYDKLGTATGSGSGMLGILYDPLYFIPMGLNSRSQSAYDDALKSVPGATALIDVTYQESWYWVVIGTMRSVTITGEAIKEVK